jgi:hypothetical protein
MAVNKCPQRHTTHDFSYLGPLEESPVPQGRQEGHILVSAPMMTCTWFDRAALTILNIKGINQAHFGASIPFWDIFDCAEDDKTKFMAGGEAKITARSLAEGCSHLDITTETENSQNIFMVNLSAEIFSRTVRRQVLVFDFWLWLAHLRCRARYRTPGNLLLRIRVKHTYFGGWKMKNHSSR